MVTFHYQNPGIISKDLIWNSGDRWNVIWGKIILSRKGEQCGGHEFWSHSGDNNFGENWLNNLNYKDILMKWQLKDIFCNSQSITELISEKIQNVCTQVFTKEPLTLWPALSMLKHCDEVKKYNFRQLSNFYWSSLLHFSHVHFCMYSASFLP